MQTIFRADVRDAQLDSLVLPDDLAVSKEEARRLAAWAQGICRYTFNEPGHDPHFKELRGNVALGAISFMDGRIAKRIRPHAVYANKHGLLMSMSSAKHGDQTVLRVDRVRDMPILAIPDDLAKRFLEILGYIDPTLRGYASVDVMERMLTRSRHDCADNCMGHYYSMLCTLCVFCRSNQGSGIYWGRDEDTPESIKGMSGTA